MCEHDSDSHSESNVTPSSSDQSLQDDLGRLHAWLNETIEASAGPGQAASVGEMRRLAAEARHADPALLDRLAEEVSELDVTSLRIASRAISISMDLSNVAEDRQRIRVLRRREAESAPSPRRESIRSAIARLAEAGRTADEMRTLIDALGIELVVTAHPTEAKRRSIRAKLRRISQMLWEFDQPELLPRERTRLEDGLRAEVAKIGQTDFIRPWPPTVINEVQRGLSMSPVLWKVVPEIMRDFREALAEQYPDETFAVLPFIRFASWIGGDRDGHPGVTVDITRQTLAWLRKASVAHHRQACCDLYGSLSLSTRQTPVAAELGNAVAEAEHCWPELSDQLATIPPNEKYRRWLTIVDWRLSRSGDVEPDGVVPRGAYAASRELDTDLCLLQASLERNHNETIANGEVQSWLDQVRTFGLHLARLDIRQDARYYETVMVELFKQAGITDDFASLTEVTRQRLLTETCGKPVRWNFEQLSENARETLSLFALLRRTMRCYGAEAVGGHVISMTRAPSDVLTILWLWHWTRRTDGGHPADDALRLPIVPLFETISDLQGSYDTMEALFDMELYRVYVADQGNQQTVMIGYSDSTKDGGYLAACWALYQAQVRIHDAACQRGVKLTFFHGRGGSLGRGGGPAARAIISLPTSTFDGAIRLTEQGEVLAERYDDSRIAHRHMEQLTWAVLLTTDRTEHRHAKHWEEIVEWLAKQSMDIYHGLVRDERFVEFFRQATPIDEIVQLPIGSRPARRKSGGSLSDLRAIPWVFSWTQIRCLVPAWFGLGSAVERLRREDEFRWQQLPIMYEQWPFFRALIDNAAMALSKTELSVARRYFRLVTDSGLAAQMERCIEDEYERSCEGVLAVTSRERLLDDIPWLRESVDRRSPSVNVLNLMQLHLLQLMRAADSSTPESDTEEWAHLIRLTIQGVAAGMRTTG
jgi:phosphoenolpyruvate carboxylase